MPDGEVLTQDLLSMGAISEAISVFSTKLLDMAAEEIKSRRSIKTDLKKKWLEKRDYHFMSNCIANSIA